MAEYIAACSGASAPGPAAGSVEALLERCATAILKPVLPADYVASAARGSLPEQPADASGSEWRIVAAFFFGGVRGAVTPAGCSHLAFTLGDETAFPARDLAIF